MNCFKSAYGKVEYPTIRERFCTYGGADYKENVVDQLLCVTTVSVAAARIVAAGRLRGCDAGWGPLKDSSD